MTTLLLIGDKCPEIETIELLGNDMILPGETGFFRCVTSNSQLLSWIIDDVPVNFDLSFIACDPPQGQHPSSVAHLVEVSVDGTFIGNRTSYLAYTSDPDFNGNVNIVCEDGRLNTKCAHTLIVSSKLLLVVVV